MTYSNLELCQTLYKLRTIVALTSRYSVVKGFPHLIVESWMDAKSTAEFLKFSIFKYHKTTRVLEIIVTYAIDSS